MKNKKLLALATLILSANLYAEDVVELSEMTDSMIMPCSRTVPMTALTRVVIPIYPGRGINLTFPPDLDMNEATTTYMMSSKDVFDYAKAIPESNIVPISTARFSDSDIGAVRDFTISMKGFVISLGLKMDVDPQRHCTNVVFTLSEAERQRVEAEGRQRYQAMLEEQFKERMDKLDEEVTDRALLLVAGLVNETPERWTVKETGSVELDNGDEVELYVHDIQNFGPFYMMSVEITNDSTKLPLYISSVEVKGTEGKAIRGTIDAPKKMEPGQMAEAVYVSKDKIPPTSGVLSVKTDRGIVDVKW